MKITDSEIIKNGEQELIDAITADLDWGAIEDIFLKEHNLGIEEDIEYKSGDIIAVDNQIAYKLEFGVKVNLSVLLDRNGEYLAVNINNRKENPKEDNVEDTEDNISEDSDTVPFGDLPDNNTDDMGQKVDDIINNIKKTG